MRFFILGIIVTIVIAFVIGLVIAQFGLMPTNADATPPAFETKIASNALDASMHRHAGTDHGRVRRRRCAERG